MKQLHQSALGPRAQIATRVWPRLAKVEVSQELVDGEATAVNVQSEFVRLLRPAAGLDLRGHFATAAGINRAAPCGAPGRASGVALFDGRLTKNNRRQRVRRPQDAANQARAVLHDGRVRNPSHGVTAAQWMVVKRRARS